MFEKKSEVYRGRSATVVKGLGFLSLSDTLECGQAFRFEPIVKEEGYCEYLTVAYSKIIVVGQRIPGELIFYGRWNEAYEECVKRYFSLDTDYEKIRQDVVSHTDSAWLKEASEVAKGIVILRQDPWETLFSFIISQNNNIPRIKKIIKSICLQYGKNLAVGQLSECPLSNVRLSADCSECKKCGACYSFPTAEDIIDDPERLLPSKPGFRYKYLLDAAEKVSLGEISLAEISLTGRYEYTLSELKKILGVGDKVASCVALFGFGNLEAFPIDVWMKRAIDEYFDGKLDVASLGQYAGVAQQYIFHYIRNLQGENK